MRRLATGLGRTPGIIADRKAMDRRGRLMSRLRTFWTEEDGPTITEYAVLLVLIVFGVFGTLTLIIAFLRNTCTTVYEGLPE